MQTFTLRSLPSLLGVSRAVISGLVAAGFVTPARGPRREYRFSFQDVVLLRTAHQLQQAQIPPRQIVRALQRLKATLPPELPLSGLRITAVGNEIAVRDGDHHYSADTGQHLLDFELRPTRGGTLTLHDAAPVAARPGGDTGADDNATAVETRAGRGDTAAGTTAGDDATPADAALAAFNEGVALESRQPRRAEAAYRRAIAAAPGFVDPVLNLGVMWCDAGRCADAIALYREALRHRPDEPLLHFNLAIALEDQQRPRDALAAYERCLVLDPGFADAHYNAARLHEALGQPERAIRHYSEYRRLEKAGA